MASITILVFQLDLAASVDRGLVREMNQDVACVVPRLRLALVADGMGGHDHGDLASRTAADALEESFERLGGPGPHPDTTAERLASAFEEANRRLAAHPASVGGQSQMGSTLVAVVFAHGRAVIGNVGDSRCYRLRGRALELLTEDHSYAAQLRRDGATATADGRAQAEEFAHVLTRCVNGDEGVTADTRIVACEPGDIYLLCSDGLWGAVDGDVIAGILRAAEAADAACERLVGAAWAGGGHDNIGVAVARLVPQQIRLHEPPGRVADPPSGEHPAV